MQGKPVTNVQFVFLRRRSPERALKITGNKIAVYVFLFLSYTVLNQVLQETEFLNSLTIRVLCVALDKPFMHGFKFGKPLKNLIGIFANVKQPNNQNTCKRLYLSTFRKSLRYLSELKY